MRQAEPTHLMGGLSASGMVSAARLLWPSFITFCAKERLRLLIYISMDVTRATAAGKVARLCVGMHDGPAAYRAQVDEHAANLRRDSDGASVMLVSPAPGALLKRTGAAPAPSPLLRRGAHQVDGRTNEPCWHSARSVSELPLRRTGSPALDVSAVGH